MKNHKHYYGWTIEWEQTRFGSWDFAIGRKVIQPYEGTELYVRTIIFVSGAVDDCIRICENLIDNIINQQNSIAEKVLNTAP
jgi:nicotinic acid phosphoribosyltransferase